MPTSSTLILRSKTIPELVGLGNALAGQSHPLLSMETIYIHMQTHILPPPFNVTKDEVKQKKSKDPSIHNTY
jgi:hypothetical protein